MAKRSKHKPASGAPEQGSLLKHSSPLKHNAFGALAGLAGALPKADEPKPPPVASEPKNALIFDQKVVVRREKKGRGGKTITRISGIAEAHRKPLSSRLKKSLGCGASCEGEDIILLGSLVDRAADALQAMGAKRVVRSN